MGRRSPAARVTVIVVLPILLALAGCSGGGPSAKKSGRPQIAVILKALDSEFWLAVRRGAEAGAEGKADLGILAPDREINVDQQVSMIENQISRGVDAIILAPAGANQVIPPLEKAAERGIPVIIVDTDCNFPKKIAYVGTNNYEGGKLAGEFVVKNVPGNAEVGLIIGIPGEETHEKRKSGFKDVLANETRLQLVAEQPANAERAMAMNVMENILTARPKLAALFATSDQMALGALEAIQARRGGRPPLLVSFDAGKEVLNLIKEGKVAAVVAQRPFQMGKLSIEAALRAIAKQPVEKVIDTGTELITKDNVASFKPE